MGEGVRREAALTQNRKGADESGARADEASAEEDQDGVVGPHGSIKNFSPQRTQRGTESHGENIGSSDFDETPTWQTSQTVDNIKT